MMAGGAAKGQNFAILLPYTVTKGFCPRGFDHHRGSSDQVWASGRVIAYSVSSNNEIAIK